MKAEVQSGLYNGASEVVRRVMRKSSVRDQNHAWLAREAAIGYARLESGKAGTVDSTEQFMKLIRDAPCDLKLIFGWALFYVPHGR